MNSGTLEANQKDSNKSDSNENANFSTFGTNCK
jgi:hypothetical protein